MLLLLLLLGTGDWWSTGDWGEFVKTGRINIHPNNILDFWVLNLNTMGIFKLVFLKVVIERAYSRLTRRVFVNIIGAIKRNYIEKLQRENRVTIDRHNREELQSEATERDYIKEHQRENRVTINRHNRERNYRAELHRGTSERK